MLLRMYLRWGESEGFKAELVEVSNGDVAGIKGATIRFAGDYAYGWLRTKRVCTDWSENLRLIQVIADILHLRRCLFRRRLTIM